ncbi:MAG TPA: DUF4012 domain-containing protein [Actinomycetota bacterium]|nr:DUF4012 domain-containing protein [Actinomycetota bacterium]
MERTRRSAADRAARRRVLLACTCLSLVLGAGTAYVVLPVAGDLSDARAVLDRSLEDVEDAELERAELSDALAKIRRASARLDSLPASVLGALPLIGRQLNAVEAVTDALDPALVSATELQGRFEDLDRAGVLAGGAIPVTILEDLEAPLAAQSDALLDLAAAAESELDGVLAPPLWSALEEVRREADDLGSAAADARDVLRHVGSLLGEDEPRTYLMMLLNNAELRGAGGVLSGIGSITVADGNVELGRFYSHQQLRSRPPIEVDAPEEYEDRYGVFEANTTLWLNVPYSADVPDVALVGGRLFEERTGTGIDGAFVIDPRGLAALMPPDAVVTVPHTGQDLTTDELPAYIYSDAYAAFDDQSQRRQAILEIGRRAFRAVLEGGAGGAEGFARAGDALAGGHIRFVSFDPQEAEALDRAGITGDLHPVDGDALLVIAQNFGGGRSQGSKLDYWTERRVAHRCSVDADRSRCVTRTTLTNRTPPGLSRYVAGTPYGLLRTYLDTLIPERAEILSVTVDGEPAEFRTEGQAGRTAAGVFLQVAPGDSSVVELSYLLDNRGRGYSLVAVPQPLAVDAELSIDLDLPNGWQVEGDGEVSHGDWSYSGPFDQGVDVVAGPADRRGLPGLWDDLIGFWNDPLF